MRVALVSESPHESLADLLCRVHSYYSPGSSVPHDLVRTYLVDHLLALDSPLRLVVASREGEQAIGFAAISLTYSLAEPAPEKRRHCWLKELYVRSSERSPGNTRGIAFYERLGARPVSDRLSYRLSGPELRKLASAC